MSKNLHNIEYSALCTLHSALKKTLHSALCTLHFLLALLLCSCESVQNYLASHLQDTMEIRRFDRVQYNFITTGDFFSLQQMCTDYPTETRTLIEDMLQIGQVDQEDVKARLFVYYQDSTLIALANDAEQRFADITPISDELQRALQNLKRMLPHIDIPVVYTQIGALTQSIVVKDGTIGISLDKYLGQDYPLYKKIYGLKERQQMTPEKIVPDCILFYLVSLYPLENFDKATEAQKDDHIGRLFYITNNALKRKVFDGKPLQLIEQTVIHDNPHITAEELLEKYKTTH